MLQPSCKKQHQAHIKGAIEESHLVKYSKKGRSYKFRLWGGVRKEENRSVEHLLGYNCLAHCYPSQIANTEYNHTG